MYEEKEVKYYTYKVEFQHRGAPHIHGVLWLDLDKLEEMNADLKIADDPGDSKPFPSLKSAFQKLKSDEELNEKDLMSLENLVETFSSVCIDPSILERLRLALYVKSIHILTQ